MPDRLSGGSSLSEGSSLSGSPKLLGIDEEWMRDVLLRLLEQACTIPDVIGATTALLLSVMSLASAVILAGVARRDHADRSIEFWLSLPVGHGASLAAPCSCTRCWRRRTRWWRGCWAASRCSWWRWRASPGSRPG